jgi:hypothetical protein
VVVPHEGKIEERDIYHVHPAKENLRLQGMEAYKMILSRVESKEQPREPA